MVKKKKTGSVLWSKDEIRLLKRLFPLGKGKQVAAKTGRALTAVRQKAYNMDLGTRRNRPWSDSDIEILKRLYPTETAKSVADRLGRSEGTVSAKAHSIGVRKTEPYVHPPWSKQEEALLRKLYLHKSHQEIADQIGRSIPAILGRAQILGLRNKTRYWSRKEVALLKKLYLTHQDNQIAARIGRSTGSVAIKRFKLGLKKRKV